MKRIEDLGNNYESFEELKLDLEQETFQLKKDFVFGEDYCFFVLAHDQF